MAEVRDLGRLLFALEGTRVGAGGGIVELCRGGEAASSVQAGCRSRDSTCKSTGGDSEGSHCAGEVQWVGIGGVGAFVQDRVGVELEVFFPAPAK